jgi:CBS domain containing-hemolysin-like protein
MNYKEKTVKELMIPLDNVFMLEERQLMEDTLISEICRK